MYSNKTLFVICFSVLVNFLLVECRGGKVPLFCTTPEARIGFQNFYVRRLLNHNGTIFVMLKDERLSFKMPYFYKKQIGHNEYEYFFLKGQVFEDEHYKDDKFYDPSKYDQIYGHLQDKGEQSVYQVNKLPSSLELDYLNKSGSFEPIRVPDSESMKKQRADSLISSNLMKPFDRFKRMSGTFENNGRILSVQVNDKEIVLAYRETSGRISRTFLFNKTNNFEFITTDMINEAHDQFIVDHLLTFFALDTNNRYAYVHQLKENYIDRSSLRDYKIHFQDFFGCSNRLDSMNDLKGILSIDNRLFAFIKQLYIEIKDPIKFIENKFQFEPEDHKKVKPLKNFKNISLEDILFEMNATKFIKTIKDVSYLTLYLDAFNIELAKNDELHFEKVIENPPFHFKSDLVKCQGQVLIVNSLAFCFKGNKYDYFGNYNAQPNFGFMNIESFKTKNIFNFTNVDYGNKEKVEIIFTYKNKTTILTESYGYTFNQNDIVSDGPMSGLYIRKGAEVVKTENCLVKCPKKDGFDLFKYVIIAILLITLVFLSATFLRFGKEGKALIKRTVSRTLERMKSKSTGLKKGSKSLEKSVDKASSKTGSKSSITGKAKSKTGSKSSITGAVDKSKSKTGSKSSITGAVDKSKSKTGSKSSITGAVDKSKSKTSSNSSLTPVKTGKKTAKADSKKPKAGSKLKSVDKLNNPKTSNKSSSQQSLNAKPQKSSPKPAK